jgi:hypothetical protein
MVDMILWETLKESWGPFVDEMDLVLAPVQAAAPLGTKQILAKLNRTSTICIPLLE